MSTTPNSPKPPFTNSSIITADERRGRRTRIFAAFGIAAVVASVGFGGHAIAAATSDQATPVLRSELKQTNDSERYANNRQGAVELGDITLDELADELAEQGLILQVTPLRDGDEAGPDSNEPGSNEPDSGEPDDSGEVDPFAGMTDEEIENLSDEDFFALLEEAGIDIDDLEVVEDDDHDDEDHGGDHDHDFGDEEVLGTFAVDGDSIDVSNATDQETADQAKEIWERFITLIPADQRQMLTSFELNPAEAGGAYVYPNGDPSTWSMGVSLGLGDDLDYVLIHEFAHLLTLQASEVPPAADADPGACSTYFTGEGCALSGTTVDQFVAKFWPQSQIDEVNRLQEEEDYDGFEAFYEEHKDDFVTDYATTNPAEDLAETFTVFVLNDRPTGDTIADQKINLLWADPDMVSLRAEIRANR